MANVAILAKFKLSNTITASYNDLDFAKYYRLCQLCQIQQILWHGLNPY